MKISRNTFKWHCTGIMRKKTASFTKGKTDNMHRAQKGGRQHHLLLRVLKAASYGLLQRRA